MILRQDDGNSYIIIYRCGCTISGSLDQKVHKVDPRYILSQVQLFVDILWSEVTNNL